MRINWLKFGDTDSQLGSPQQAEYQLQEPMHHHVQAEPMHYQLQQPMHAEYQVQAPHEHQHYQLQAPFPAQPCQLQAPAPAEYQVQQPMTIEQVPFPGSVVIPESHQLEAAHEEDSARHWKGWNKKGDDYGYGDDSYGYDNDKK